jgi:hypothetical protein
MDMLRLLKTSGDLQIFAAVTHLVEGLTSLKYIARVKGRKVSNLPNGYMEANNVHNRTTVNFILENDNRE